MDIKLQVIYEDNNFIFVNKPAGINSHEDKFSKDNILISIRKYLGNKNSLFIPQLNNRLDKKTSGIIICSKNKEAHTFMNKTIENKMVQKYYLCLIKGKFDKQEDTLIDYLHIGEDKVYIEKKSNDTNLKIITKYNQIWTNNNYSILDIELVTGKKHQIRAHLAFYDHPVIGEDRYVKYKTKSINYQLVAYKLVFNVDNDKYSYLNKLNLTLDKQKIISNFKKEINS